MHEKIQKNNIIVHLVDGPENTTELLDKIYESYLVCRIDNYEDVLEKINNTSDKDKDKFIYKYYKMGHETPVEFVSFGFVIENISRACSHQIVRHRLSSIAQLSQRSNKEDNYVIPDLVKDNNDYKKTMDIIYNTYNKLIKDGVKKEDARFILPNACTTNLKIKMNLRNWFHFFYERSCYKAQWEIRIVSDLILELLVTKYSLNENILKIFIDAGQKCLKLGYCPNNCSKGCPGFRKRSFNVVF